MVSKRGNRNYDKHVHDDQEELTPYDVAMRIVTYDRAMDAHLASEEETRRRFLSREYDAFSKEELRKIAVDASIELTHMRERLAWYEDYLRSSSESQLHSTGEENEGDLTYRCGQRQRKDILLRKGHLEKEVGRYTDAIRFLPLY